MIVEYILGLGIALLTSALTGYLRDLAYILSIIAMAWQFLTPVMYSQEMVLDALASYPTLETQILEMEEVFWKKAADGAWPREAFDMNAKAMLRTVAAEFPEELSKAKSIQK